jgi:hypothetical protein
MTTTTNDSTTTTVETLTAGYLVELHPHVVDDPVEGQVRSLYVELAVCPRCGAVVHEEQTHDAWHVNTKEVLA